MNRTLLLLAFLCYWLIDTSSSQGESSNDTATPMNNSSATPVDGSSPPPMDAGEPTLQKLIASMGTLKIVNNSASMSQGSQNSNFGTTANTQTGSKTSGTSKTATNNVANSELNTEANQKNETYGSSSESG